MHAAAGGRKLGARRPDTAPATGELLPRETLPLESKRPIAKPAAAHPSAIARPRTAALRAAARDHAKSQFFAPTSARSVGRHNADTSAMLAAGRERSPSPPRRRRRSPGRRASPEREREREHAGDSAPAPAHAPSHQDAALEEAEKESQRLMRREALQIHARVNQIAKSWDDFRAQFEDDTQPQLLGADSRSKANLEYMDVQSRIRMLILEYEKGGGDQMELLGNLGDWFQDLKSRERDLAQEVAQAEQSGGETARLLSTLDHLNMVHPQMVTEQNQAKEVLVRMFKRAALRKRATKDGAGGDGLTSAQYEATLDGMEGKMAQQQHQIERLTQQLGRANEEVEQRELALISFRKQIGRDNAELTKENAAMKNRMVLLEKTVAMQEQKIRIKEQKSRAPPGTDMSALHLDENIGPNPLEIQKLEDDLKDARVAAGELRNTVRRLEEEIEHLRSSLAASVGEANQVHSKHRSEIAKLRKQFEESRNRIVDEMAQEHESVVSGLTEKHTQALSSLRWRLKDKLETSEGNVKVLSRELEAATEKLGTEREATERLQGELRAANEATRAAKRETEEARVQARHEMRELQQEVEKAAADYEELLERLEDQQVAARRAALDAQKEAKVHEQQLLMAQQEAELAAAAAEERERELKIQFIDEKARLREELEAETEAKLEDAARQAAKDLADEQARAEDRRKALEREQEKEREKAGAVAHEAEEERRQRAGMEEQLGMALEALKAAEEQLDEAHRDNAKMQVNVDRLVAEVKEAQLKATREEQRNELLREEAAAASSEELEFQVTVLTAKASTLEAEAGAAKEHAEGLQRVVDDLQTALRTAQASEESMCEELAETVAALESGGGGGRPASARSVASSKSSRGGGGGSRPASGRPRPPPGPASRPGSANQLARADVEFQARLAATEARKAEVAMKDNEELAALLSEAYDDLGRTARMLNELEEEHGACLKRDSEAEAALADELHRTRTELLLATEQLAALRPRSRPGSALSASVLRSRPGSAASSSVASMVADEDERVQELVESAVAQARMEWEEQLAAVLNPAASSHEDGDDDAGYDDDQAFVVVDATVQTDFIGGGGDDLEQQQQQLLQHQAAQIEALRDEKRALQETIKQGEEAAAALREELETATRETAERDRQLMTTQRTLKREQDRKKILAGGAEHVPGSDAQVLMRQVNELSQVIFAAEEALRRSQRAQTDEDLREQCAGVIQQIIATRKQGAGPNLGKLLSDRITEDMARHRLRHLEQLRRIHTGGDRRLQEETLAKERHRVMKELDEARRVKLEEEMARRRAEARANVIEEQERMEQLRETQEQELQKRKEDVAEKRRRKKEALERRLAASPGAAADTGSDTDSDAADSRRTSRSASRTAQALAQQLDEGARAALEKRLEEEPLPMTAVKAAVDLEATCADISKLVMQLLEAPSDAALVAEHAYKEQRAELLRGVMLQWGERTVKTLKIEIGERFRLSTEHLEAVDAEEGGVDEQDLALHRMLEAQHDTFMTWFTSGDVEPSYTTLLYDASGALKWDVPLDQFPDLLQVRMLQDMRQYVLERRQKTEARLEHERAEYARLLELGKSSGEEVRQIARRLALPGDEPKPAMVNVACEANIDLGLKVGSSTTTNDDERPQSARSAYSECEGVDFPTPAQESERLAAAELHAEIADTLKRVTAKCLSHDSALIAVKDAHERRMEVVRDQPPSAEAFDAAFGLGPERPEETTLLDLDKPSAAAPETTTTHQSARKHSAHRRVMGDLDQHVAAAQLVLQDLKEGALSSRDVVHVLRRGARHLDRLVETVRQTVDAQASAMASVLRWKEEEVQMLVAAHKHAAEAFTATIDADAAAGDLSDTSRNMIACLAAKLDRVQHELDTERGRAELLERQGDGHGSLELVQELTERDDAFSEIMVIVMLQRLIAADEARRLSRELERTRDQRLRRALAHRRRKVRRRMRLFAHRLELLRARRRGNHAFIASTLQRVEGVLKRFRGTTFQQLANMSVHGDEEARLRSAAAAPAAPAPLPVPLLQQQQQSSSPLPGLRKTPPRSAPPRKGSASSPALQRGRSANPFNNRYRSPIQASPPSAYRPPPSAHRSGALPKLRPKSGAAGRSPAGPASGPASALRRPSTAARL